jgi:hypothetical protein
LPAQQPFGHVVPLHVAPAHMPVLQAPPPGQAAQVAPLAPQTLLLWLEYGTQVVPMQQPLPQLVPLQPVEGHMPLVQAPPLGHAEQVAPPAPHTLLLWLAYGTQVVPMQQPFAQVVESQTAGQVPLVQAPPPGHAAQAAPAVPQRLLFWFA